MKKESYNNVKYKRNINIIDMQDNVDYNAFHFPGAVNYSYDYIMDNYREMFNKNQVYYFYCYSGKLSRRVVMILSSLGYNAIMLEK